MIINLHAGLSWFILAYRLILMVKVIVIVKDHRAEVTEDCTLKGKRKAQSAKN